jgi:L-ribulose-5-phosphate 3-epimerase
MDRRTFLQKFGLTALAAPLYGFRYSADPRVEIAAYLEAGVSMDRMGMTTVSFRSRFPSTARMGEPTTAPNLSLETAPRFIADEFGIHNVEVWDQHFDDFSIEYCERVREAAARSGSRIINIQSERVVGVSSPDPEVRDRAVANAHEWMDRATAMGCPSVRINTGGSPTAKMDLEVTAGSFRRIAEYGEAVGVMVLIENHGGYSARIANVAAIVAAVDHPMCRSIIDFGNTPAQTTDDRIADISRLFPTLQMVSAKGVDFDESFDHVSYDIGALVRATEASGFRGIYSVELYTSNAPPPEPIRAARTVKREILANLAP